MTLREYLDQVLYEQENIGSRVVPETQEGQLFQDGALTAICLLCGVPDGPYREGLLRGVELFRQAQKLEAEGFLSFEE